VRTLGQRAICASSRAPGAPGRAVWLRLLATRAETTPSPGRRHRHCPAQGARAPGGHRVPLSLIDDKQACASCRCIDRLVGQLRESPRSRHRANALHRAASPPTASPPPSVKADSIEPPRRRWRIDLARRHWRPSSPFRLEAGGSDSGCPTDLDSSSRQSCLRLHARASISTFGKLLRAARKYAVATAPRHLIAPHPSRRTAQGRLSAGVAVRSDNGTNTVISTSARRYS